MDNLNTKSNEELLQLIKEGTAIHTEAIIMEVEVILMERDIQFNSPYKKSKRPVQSNSELPKRTTVKGLIVAPFLVGVLFVASPFILSSLITIPKGADAEQLFYLNIGAIIVKRIIVLSIVDYYNKKLTISGALWYILGVVFGGWSLLAYNIYLWANFEKENDEAIDK